MNKTGFTRYANGNTPYITGDSIENIGNSLETAKWFVDSQARANKSKYHLLKSNSGNITINVDGNLIEKSIWEKFLASTVDYKLKFNRHLDSILKKAGQKVNAL